MVVNLAGGTCEYPLYIGCTFGTPYILSWKVVQVATSCTCTRLFKARPIRPWITIESERPD